MIYLSWEDCCYKIFKYKKICFYTQDCKLVKGCPQVVRADYAIFHGDIETKLIHVLGHSSGELCLNCVLCDTLEEATKKQAELNKQLEREFEDIEERQRQYHLERHVIEIDAIYFHEHHELSENYKNASYYKQFSESGQKYAKFLQGNKVAVEYLKNHPTSY